MTDNKTTRAKSELQSSESSLTERERFGRWQADWNINVQPSDKQRLVKFMNEELSFYNSLVDSFNSRLRCQPETIGLLLGDWEKIFATCAEISFNVAKLRNSNIKAELPAKLEEFRNLLLGRDEKNQRFLTEKYIVLLECCAAPGVIHPLARRNMALEVLRFYKDQAKLALQETKISGFDGTSYKNSFVNLEKLDDTRKRHLQVPKEALRYKYDSVNKILRIWTPYNSVPFEIPNFGNVDEKPWNLLLIHQQPGKVANHNTPWMLEFKNVPNQYMLKLVEVSNPYLSSAKFRFAKATSGFRA